MNDAPRRLPESIVNVWSLVSVPAPNRLIAVAATGEPESTKYAPSHPVPRVETPFANGNSPLDLRADGLRPGLHELDRQDEQEDRRQEQRHLLDDEPGAVLARLGRLRVDQVVFLREDDDVRLRLG